MSGDAQGRRKDSSSEAYNAQCRGHCYVCPVLRRHLFGLSSECVAHVHYLLRRASRFKARLHHQWVFNASSGQSPGLDLVGELAKEFGLDRDPVLSRSFLQLFQRGVKIAVLNQLFEFHVGFGREGRAECFPVVPEAVFGPGIPFNEQWKDLACSPAQLSWIDRGSSREATG